MHVLNILPETPIGVDKIDNYCYSKDMLQKLQCKRKRKQMKLCSIHLQSRLGSAKQAGFMPTYWSATVLSSNDRTPEISLGFLEGSGYA